VIKILLLLVSPAALLALIGSLLRIPSLSFAGLIAVTIILVGAPLAIAAQSSHRSFGASASLTAAAMAVRLSGLVTVALCVHGHSQSELIEVAVAACLIVNVIIERFLASRTGERFSNAR
jgi:hypothetical protein